MAVDAVEILIRAKNLTNGVFAEVERDLRKTGTTAAATNAQIGTMSQGLGTMRSMLSSLGVGLSVGALQGGVNPMSAAGSMIGSSVLSGWAKSLTTAKDGAAAALSGWLGGAASAVMPFVGSLLGPLVGKITDKLFSAFDRNKGRDAVKAFAESMGGFDALHAQLGKLGDAGEALWKRLTQGTGRNDPRAAAAAIEAIRTALANAETKAATFNSALGGLLGQVQALGGSLPSALREYLRELERGGTLTTDNIALLEQLSGGGAASWKQIEEAVGRYGGEISKLGGTFQKQRLHESWQQIIDDMDLFERGGVSTGDALALVKGKIIELVNQSVKFGTEIPENMKPYIQSLITSGELVDENGEKIEDINKLKFGESLQTSLQKLIDSIKDLIGEFRKVPGEVAAIPRNVDTTVTIRRRVIDERLEPSGSGEPEVGHAVGAYIRSDHTARVHAGEIVGPVDFIARAMAKANAMVGSAGGAATIVVQSVLDGRVIAENQVQYQGRVLAPYGVGR